jgi:hypothetical protein
MDLMVNPVITDFQQDVNGDIKMLKIGANKEDAYANIVEQGADAKLDNNKTATIDVSTYTEPVEVLPTSGKDGMKKATITLSNIPSGSGYDFTDNARNTFYLFKFQGEGSQNDFPFLLVQNGLAVSDLSTLTSSAKAYLLESGHSVDECTVAVSGTDITIEDTTLEETYTGTTSAESVEVDGLIALISYGRYA